MKKSFMTRALAMGLSLAMAFSLSAATNVSVASAASTPAMASKQFAVRVGGAAKSYKASAATQKSYKISKATVGNTDKATVKVNSSKKSIKVTPGTVTGTTVVKITFKNIKTAKTTSKKYRCVVKAAAEKPSTVAKITAIKQTSATKLAAEFSADMTGIKYTDLKIVRDETGAVVTVKSATVDKNDNTKVTIETYEGLTDGKAYTVTYTAADEAKTESSANFTATAGVVADIALNTYSIPANTPTVIKYQTLDANGVIIAEAGIGKSAGNNMEISIENFNGYQNDNELLLYKTGDKATLKVVYHTWKYNNTDGKEEGKVEKTFEITAVDPSSVIETYDYTIADVNDVVDFKRDTLKTQLAMEDDKGTADPYAFFSFRKADGTDITKSLDYTVSSGNENVLLANGNVAGGAQLTPVGVGATYLMIKNASGSIVKTLPITVVAKRELSTMTVDTPNVTVSESSSAAGTQTITIAVMDQYSDAYSKYTAATQPELKSSNNDSGLSFNVTQSGNKTFVKVTSYKATAGTYSYTLDLSDDEKANNVKKVSFSVTVSKQLSGTSLALVMMNDTQTGVVNKVDTTVGGGAYNDITLKPTIVVKNNGSIIRVANIGSAATDDVVSYGALTLKKNGTKIDTAKGYYTRFQDSVINNDAKVYVATTTTQAQDFTTGIKTIVKNLDPGTYTLTLTATMKDGKTKQNMSTSFVVEDSQKVFEATVKKESVAAGISTLEGVFESTDYVTFSYAGHVIDPSEYAYQYVSADTTYTNVNKALRVKKVTVDIALPGTGNSQKIVRMTADVNRTFTFTDAIASVSNVTNGISTFNSAYVSGTALKSTVTTGQCIDAVNYALYVQDQFNALTTDEQTTALKTKVDAVKAVGQEAAVKVLNKLDTITTGQTKALWDALVIFKDDISGSLVYDDLDDYAKLIAGSDDFTALTTTSGAITKIDNMLTEISTARSKAKQDVQAVKSWFNGKTVSDSALTSSKAGSIKLSTVAASGSTISITSSTAIVASGGTITKVAPSYSSGELLFAITTTGYTDGAKFTATLDPIVATQTVQLGTIAKGKSVSYTADEKVTITFTYNSTSGNWTLTTN